MRTHLLHPDIDGTRLEMAKAFLCEFLAKGQKPEAEVIARGEEMGFSERVLRRASQALVIGSTIGDVSHWHLTEISRKQCPAQRSR